MSKTKFKITRNRGSKLIDFPRHLLKKYAGNHLSIRRYLGASYNMNLYDVYPYFSGYGWLYGYLDKHEGEEWDLVKNNIIKILKDNKIPNKDINDIFRFLIRTTKVGRTKYRVIDGVLHFDNLKGWKLINL